MSHITQAQQGLTAVEAKNWDEAIAKLSPALQNSSNPAWLIGRSRALVGVKRYKEALADADLAWHSAFERNKRPQLLEAQYRRAVAYFRLGELANADCCCVYAMRLAKGGKAVEKVDPKETFLDDKGFWTVTMEEAKKEAAEDEINKMDRSMAMGQESTDTAKDWRKASTLRLQILFALDKLPADDLARKVTVTLKPQQSKLADVRPPSNNAEETKTSAPVQQPAARPPVPANTPLRVQEFQSKTTMSVSIFSKGVNKDDLKVDYHSHAVRMNSIVYPSGERAPFQLELWGEIDPSASKHSVTPNKVELTLAKKTPGTWKSLFSETKETKMTPQAQQDESVHTAPTTDTVTTEAASAAVTSPSSQDTTQHSKSLPQSSAASSSAAAGPSYPTSSKMGPRDWDKLAEEGDNSEDDEGRDVNGFFKKLFKGATPEQQRAMMKSFTESNGTSLSTDWNDVKERKVETVPPEGVEAKKWGA